MAQSANWLKRTDRLLCREAETSVKILTLLFLDKILIQI
jgi:hypothetical protein